MLVATLKNRIPDILKDVGWNISDLQRETRLSYPAVHALAREQADELSNDTRINTLQVIADAFTRKTGRSFSVTDLYTVENDLA